MNLYFCDLCNESIPQADLDLGRAVRRNERLICTACEAAMTSAPASAPEPSDVAPAPRPLARAPSTSPLPAIALAVACVALLVGAGGGAYLFWRLDESARALHGEVVDVERAAPAHARTVSAALAEETSARETDVAAARAEVQALVTRVQELEQAGADRAALERRVDKLDGRLAALGDLASRVEHESGALEQLAATVAELSAARAQSDAAGAGAHAAPASDPAPAAKGAALAPAPGVPPWQGFVADLASADSGTRWQAVQALGDTHDPAVVPHLVPVLGDADIFVRMAACRHLGDLGSLEAIPALIDALEDEEALVREAAYVALDRLSGKGQQIPFDAYARDGDRSKRVRAWRDWWQEASKELLGGAKDTPKPKSKG